MNRKIIHQKIPTDQFGNILTNVEMVVMFHNKLKEAVEGEYIVITSPFETTCLNKDEDVICIEGKEYSTDELLEIIAKASMYDGLCK